MRTHSTFSGTLKKSKFKGADLALLEDFLPLGSSEPSVDCRVANQERKKWMRDLNISLGAKEGMLAFNSPTDYHLMISSVSLMFLFPESKEPRS